MRGRFRDGGAPLAFVLASLALEAGCGGPTCVTGEEDACVIASPCEGLSVACGGGYAIARVLEGGDAVPEGSQVLAAPGDFVLENGSIVAVVDGLGHPHHLAPTGGHLLDLATVTANTDGLVQLATALGIEPGRGVVYDRYRLVEENGVAAVQVRGHAEGHMGVQVITRFEIRPCEPGIRIRTEVRNRGSAPIAGTPGDVFFWGGRGERPFAPNGGGGFEHGVGEGEVSDRVSFPWLASAPAALGEPSHACVPCGASLLHGVHGDVASFAGAEGDEIVAGATVVFERFVGVADGRGAAPGIAVALDLHERLAGDAVATVRGTLTTPPTDGAPVDVLLTAEGSPGATPIAHAVPDASGAWEARVPAGASYEATLLAFGRVATTAGPTGMLAGGDDASLSLAGTSVAALDVSVALDGAPTEALIALVPSTASALAAVSARWLGAAPTCAPLLGPPRGGPRACNRAVVSGRATLPVPPGSYFVYASRGPFATLARSEVSVDAGATVPVALALTSVAARPSGTRAVDFRVYGASSFDSATPDAALVSAVLAAGLDAAVATDHDTAYDYGPAVAAIGASGRVRIFTGVATTSLVPFAIASGASPTTAGQLGLFPIAPLAGGPWRGAPLDEGIEPGIVMTRAASEGWSEADGLAVLHTPWGAPRLGRDVGFPRALGIDARAMVPLAFDGSANATLVRAPPGSLVTNVGWNAIEVVDGEDWEGLLASRALWFWLLDEGFIRAGVASSGARGLGVAFPGTPRTLVWTGAIDGAALGAAVRSGRAIGTNGPVIEVTMRDSGGADHTPSLDGALVPPSAPTVHVRVSAAPWVPIDEVRVVVNGRVVSTTDTQSAAPPDPFGSWAAVRWEGDVSIDGSLPFEIGDAWLVVEAGTALPAAGDLDCDGIPDTGDNDGNGAIDASDVGVRAGPSTPAPVVATISDACIDAAGPLRAPHVAPGAMDPDRIFADATGAPIVYAFTNPILIDVDGGGYARR